MRRQGSSPWLQPPILVALIVALIGAVALLVGTVIAPFATESAKRRFDASDLELVDVSIREPGKAGAPAPTKLDVKVSNTGEKVTYLKEANFEVKKTWELWSTGFFFPRWVPVSGTYTVPLKPTDAPYTRTVKLSQAIDPNEVDRISFILAVKEPDPISAGYVNHVLLTTVDLVYDEDDRVISSGNLLFVREPDALRPWPSGFQGYYPPQGVTGTGDRFQDHRLFEAEAVRDHNARVADEIGAIDGKKSESLEKLLRYISQETQR